MLLMRLPSTKWARMVRLTALLTLVLLSIATTHTEARYLELFNRNSRSPAALGPPVRPKVFHTADELSTYLAELADYYAVLGRPRFGKRGGSSLSSPRRYEAPPSTQLLVAQRNFRSAGAGDQDTMEYLYDTDDTGDKEKAGPVINGW